MSEGNNLAPVLKDFNRKVTSLAKDQAAGKDSNAKLFVLMTEASREGIITLDKDAKSQEDDARRVASKFLEISASTTFADPKKAASLNTQASKLRLAVKLGQHPADVLNVIADAQEIHKEHVDRGLKVISAVNMLHSVARKQLESPEKLTREEIAECIQPREAEEPTIASVLAAMHKKMEKTIFGEMNADLRQLDDEMQEKIISIEEQLREVCATFAHKQVIADAKARLAEAQAALEAAGVAA